MLVARGIVLGVPIALATTRFVMSQLPGVRQPDALIVAVAMVRMTIAGLLAGFIPARRASRVDPMLALRAE